MTTKPFFWLFFFSAIVSILVGFFGSACSNRNYDGEGEAVLLPEKSFFMTEGEHTIRFTVGKQGIKTGGGIKTRFPKRCFPQIKDPQKNDFLKITLSRKESDFKVRIKHRDKSLDDQSDKVVITLEITEKPLREGDTIALTIVRGTSIPYYPSRIKTFPPPYPAGSEILPVITDQDGDGNFAIIRQPPIFTVPPGAPERIHAFASSTQKAGRQFELKVAALDIRNNLATGYRGTVAFASSDPRAVLPEPYTFTKGDDGTRKFPVTLNTHGYQTITLIDGKNGWSVRSNPIDCTPHDREKIWWGDIHSHSEISADGIGSGSFMYAKDVAGLDFYSLTDHSTLARMEKLITEEEWNFTKQKTILFYQPGKFVTIPGYECSMSSPSGHYNVYFNCSNDLIPQIPLFGEPEVKNDLLTLWKILDQRLPEGIEAITIPHHTGMVWRKDKVFGHVDFDKYRNPQKRVAIEIHSSHGSSEKYDPRSPLSYEHFWNNRNTKKPISELDGHFSQNGPHYAQDAWSRKLYLGTIASSDDHMAHPGTDFPLVAAYARELTRDSIFKAIKTRRTYATTGERIILKFSLNGQPMGSKTILTKKEKPNLLIEARGTGLIEFVEILKWDFYNGIYDQDRHPIFKTVLKKKINRLSCRINFIDIAYKNDSMYYIRLKQFKRVRNQEVWAWSSPIWVKSNFHDGPHVTP